jgi:hypothetical protein
VGLDNCPLHWQVWYIAHGHGNAKCAQHSNELWLNDPNFIIGSLLRFFGTLEKAPTCESKMLFEHPPQNMLFTRPLQGKSCCTSELKTQSECWRLWCRC